MDIEQRLFLSCLEIIVQKFLRNHLVSGIESQTRAGQIVQRILVETETMDYLYDPVTAGIVIHRSLITTNRLSIEVILEGENIGQTCINRKGVHNVDVARMPFDVLLLDLLKGGF